VAALLSFLFPGAGELYNGTPYHYLFLVLLHPVVTLGALPVILDPASPAILVTASLFLFLAAIPFISALHAWFQARNVQKIIAGFWNRPTGLILSILFALFLRVIPVLVLVQFLSLHRVSGMENAPTLLPGEVLLCSHLAGEDIQPGELVLDINGRTARVIALPGESVVMEGGVMLVDRFPLVHKHVRDRELFRLGIDDPSSVTSERHRDRRYAVTMGTFDLQKRKIQANTLLVITDNRSMGNPVRSVPAASLEHRVEGVLLPALWQRFLLQPCLPYSSPEEVPRPGGP
jgi:hypothetical protein